MISFCNLKIGYAIELAEVAITHLNRGEVYALIGKNGSGKSTFLQTICGVVKPLSGTILINQKKLSDYDRNALSKEIAFVPSRFPIVDFMKVEEFINLGRTPYINQFGKLKEQDEMIVKEVVKRLDLQHLLKKSTLELSDGERQLCSIARALVQKTSLLLLDEPTNFLDYKNKRLILSLLINIAKEFEMTILFSTHDLEVVQQFEIQKIGINNNKILEMIENDANLEEIVVEYY